MKKKIIISLGIIILIAIIVAIVVLIINKPIKGELYGKKDHDKADYKDHYTATYSASYNDPVIILDDKKNHELVNNEARLNEILNKTKNQDLNSIFNSKFFENNQVLVVKGGIGSEINKMEVSDTNANIIIYYASPLISAEEMKAHDLYIIPVSKNIQLNNINVTSTTYPDRLY